MKTDLPLKTLFQHHAADLLALTGDDGATVISAAPVEVSARELRVDTLLRLRGPDGQLYFRHVEFQARWRPGFERRMFDYNTRLNAWLRHPVLTTVLWVFPPGPRGEPVYRVRHQGREVNTWRYDSVWRNRRPGLPRGERSSGGETSPGHVRSSLNWGAARPQTPLRRFLVSPAFSVGPALNPGRTTVHCRGTGSPRGETRHDRIERLERSHPPRAGAGTH